MVETVLAPVERGREVQQQPVILPREHAAVGEAAAVEVTRYLVADGMSVVPHAQKVGVERMDGPVIGNRRGGSGERLCDDLAPEHTPGAGASAIGGARSLEDVATERIDPQQRSELVHQRLGRGSCCILAP
jgi:hypothetical protein